MLELKRPFTHNPSESSVNLLCVVKNEILLLPYFISYYKKLGISHFTFIDNNSSDGTFELLLAHEEIECQVYHTSDSYAENLFGVAWVNEILNLQFKNKWCIVVDVDELLFLKDNSNLLELQKAMIKENSNILTTTLLDFYPKRFDETKYIQSESFLSHSSYYDKVDMNFKNIFMEVQMDNAITLKGGVRSRVLGDNATNDSMCLTKKSFFKYDFYKTHRLSEGMHWIEPHEFKDWMDPDTLEIWKKSNFNLKFYSKLLLLGHFKYLKPNIFDYFKERFDAGEDWAGPGINGSRGDGVCQEYKTYIENKVDTFYDKDISKNFLSISKTYEDTVDSVLEYISDIDRFRRKSLYVVISEQRHGSTTLCEKINEFQDTISLFEAFGPTGIFYTPEQWKQDLEPHMCRIINGTSWLRNIDNISFKVFSDHGVKLDSLMQLPNLKKIIFLRRELKDSYNSLKKTLKEGNWQTNPNIAKNELIGYDYKRAQQEEFWAVDSSGSLITFEKYKSHIENWMNNAEKLANQYEIPSKTIYFWNVIHDQIDDKIFK